MERKRVINPHLYLHKGKMPVFIKSITPLGLCLSIIPLFQRISSHVKSTVFHVFLRYINTDKRCLNAGSFKKGVPRINRKRLPSFSCSLQTIISCPQSPLKAEQPYSIISSVSNSRQNCAQIVPTCRHEQRLITNCFGKYWVMTRTNGKRLNITK